MAIERDDVLRRDFPVARKGYDPSAVDAHLRKVADRVDELAKTPAPKDTAGAAAAGKVQAIVEAAERSADEIERQARDDAESTRATAAADAREHVERVSVAATAMRARIDELESELTGLLTRLKSEGGEVALHLEALRAQVGEVRSAEVDEPEIQDAVVEEAEPEPEPAPGDAAVDALEDEVEGAETLVAEMEATVTGVDDDERRLAAIKAAIAQETAAPAEDDELDEAAEEAEIELVEENADEPDAPDEDIEGARLVALRLALKGESQEAITRELVKFHLSDPDALIGDVLEKAGR